MPGRQGVQRRALLGVALGSAAAAARAAPALPDHLLSKQEAEYQDSPKGLAMCASCTLFVRPDQCKVVEGPVRPEGWCKLFDMVD